MPEQSGCLNQREANCLKGAEMAVGLCREKLYAWAFTCCTGNKGSSNWPIAVQEDMR